jgi:hypothetical protein
MNLDKIKPILWSGHRIGKTPLRGLFSHPQSIFWERSSEMRTFQAYNGYGNNLTVQITDDCQQFCVWGDIAFFPSQEKMIPMQLIDKTPSLFGPSRLQQVKYEPVNGHIKGRLSKIPQVRSVSGHK